MTVRKEDNEYIAIYAVYSKGKLDKYKVVLKEFCDYYEVTTRKTKIDQLMLASLIFEILNNDKLREIDTRKHFELLDNEIYFEKEEEYDTVFRKLNPLFAKEKEIVL